MALELNHYVIVHARAPPHSGLILTLKALSERNSDFAVSAGASSEHSPASERAGCCGVLLRRTCYKLFKENGLFAAF
jgi:hypothetical protein